MRTNRFVLGKTAAAIALIAVSFAARAADDFTKGIEGANQLYDQGKYAEAAGAYESIVRDGRYSAALFYNLGNAEFRLEKPGAAILNYERASFLSPGNPEIGANLAYARGQTGARIAEKDWRDEIVMNLGVNTYCWLAAIAAWAAIFAVAALFFQRSPKAWLSLAAICCTMAAGYAMFAIHHLEKDDSLAIVTARTTGSALCSGG